MIYLFRKRNGSIIANTKESADRTLNSPNNFITYQPEFLGAVSPADFKAVAIQAKEDVPIELEKLVKKGGEDTLITLSRSQILDAIEGGDQRLEKQYEEMLAKQQVRYVELLEELALKADKTNQPVSYSHKVAAVEGAVGNVDNTLQGYVYE